jgi:subtilase family serine protease
MSDRRFDRRRLSAVRVLVPALLAITVLIPFPANATTRGSGKAKELGHLVAIGDRAVVPEGSTLLGALPRDAPMSIEVVLPPRSPGLLQETVAAITTPGSPAFRHYLSRGAFASRFGATSEMLNEVRSGLSRLGLGDARVNANRLALLVHASSSVVAQALHVQLNRYRNASGEEFIEPSGAPLLPASIAGHVSAILGLSTEAQVKPAGLILKRPTAEAHPSAVSASPYTATESTGCEQSITYAEAGYTPDQIASAYGMSGLYAAGDLGAGVSIGVIEFAPFVTSDIDAYAACLGVTPSVSVASVDGGPQTLYAENPGVEEVIVDNIVESELDLEDLIGLAPDASIIDYEGASVDGDVSAQATYDTYAAAINADATQIISTSWGTCEPSLSSQMITAENTIFEQAALQGQTVVAAAGDEGSEDCSDGSPLGNPQNNELAVDDPASQPFVTGVGGTTLTLEPTRQEVVWNTGQDTNNPGAGGGGVSADWSMPAYQADAATSLGVAAAGSAPGTCKRTGGCRLVPDVSLNAGTPYAVFCTVTGCGGWASVVGTSGAAPTFAAMIALAESSETCAASLPATDHSLGFVNPALYAIAGGANGAKAFIEVTSGDNDVLGTNGGDYQAGPGYNLATGLGAPIAGNGSDGALVDDLCSPSTLSDVVESGGLTAPKLTELSPKSGSSGGGERVTITGTDLEDAVAVLFGTTPATSFRQLSATRISAVAPADLGKIHVTVVTRAGVTALVREGVFAFKVIPVIDRLAPPTGPTSGHNVVVIVGTGLSGATAVHFGAQIARSFQVRSSTRIKATVPPGQGVVTVTVTTRMGVSKSTATTRYHYR